MGAWSHGVSASALPGPRRDIGPILREPVGMDELRWHVDGDLGDDLDRPIVAVAYRGLFDASGAATGAVTWLSERFDATVVGDVDPETFYDFTQERPVAMFDGDGERHLHWASNEVLVAHEGTPRDLVLMSGVEPHLRWRTFAETLVEVVRRTGAESVVTLGAMAGMAPHSRPLAVVASSTNPRLADRLGLERPSYQGPTGLIGVLHDALDRAGVPVISLRVAVPHYVPDTPSPKATRSLLRRFEQVTGIETGYADLDGPAAEWQRHVDHAVRDDVDFDDYVRRLEAEADESEDLMPSGDDLAAEFEAFLREQDRPAGDADPS